LLRGGAKREPRSIFWNTEHTFARSVPRASGTPTCTCRHAARITYGGWGALHGPRHACMPTRTVHHGTLGSPWQSSPRSEALLVLVDGVLLGAVSRSDCACAASIGVFQQTSGSPWNLEGADLRFVDRAPLGVAEHGDLGEAPLGVGLDVQRQYGRYILSLCHQTNYQVPTPTLSLCAYVCGVHELYLLELERGSKRENLFARGR
jgi:hypothetical protein